MLTLKAKNRKEVGKKAKKIIKEGRLPAVIYGYKVKSTSLEVDYKDFEKVFTEAGESSLVSLEIAGKKEQVSVLIHQIQRDPLSNKFIHIDFYQPSLTEEVTVSVPLVFDGEAPAVKELGGTFIKNISEIEIRALPQSLPHEIRIDIFSLKTFDDFITVKDLKITPGAKIIHKSPDDIVAQVAPPEKVEEELVKPIEEKVEEVEKVETKKKEEGGKEESVFS